MQVAKDNKFFFLTLNLFAFDQEVLLIQFYSLYYTRAIIIVLISILVVYIDML